MVSEFEYFSAVIAVVLALGVTHILGQISSFVQDRESVRWHWLPGIWIAVVFVAHFSAWWNIWALERNLDFSFHVFLYMLVGPTALFLAARLVIPPIRAGAVLDLRQHYFSVHRVFFAAIGVFILWPVLFGLVLQEPPPLNKLGEHLGLLVPILACALSRNMTVHTVVAVLVGLVFGASILIGM